MHYSYVILTELLLELFGYTNIQNMPNLCIRTHVSSTQTFKYAQPLYTHVSSTQTFKICPTSIYVHMCRALKHSNMPNLCIHLCRALKHSKYAQPLYTHVSSTQTFKICPTSIYTCVEHSNIQICLTSVYTCVEHSNIQNMPNLCIHMCRALKHSKYAQPLYTHVSSTQTFKYAQPLHTHV